MPGIPRSWQLCTLASVMEVWCWHLSGHTVACSDSYQHILAWNLPQPFRAALTSQSRNSEAQIIYFFRPPGCHVALEVTLKSREAGRGGGLQNPFPCSHWSAQNILPPQTAASTPAGENTGCNSEQTAESQPLCTALPLPLLLLQHQVTFSR